MLKKIIIGLVVVLILIQFIRPARNESVGISENDITKHYSVPENVQVLLKKACYDCHSNNTVYPWYANIQPVGWWLANHVNDGKDELNFSEFGSYKNKRANHKLEEISEQVSKHEMPLDSYLWIHSEAKLSEEENKSIIDWAKALQATIPKE